ncbi:MAG: FtsX-like permease family protein [Microthrixaceae bacterium]
MRSALREMRRAPLRVAASTLAIALAIAAMGIFAIPSMASNTLRDIAAADLAAHLQLTTTPFDATTLRAEIEQMDGVEAVELGTTGTVTFGSGGTGGEGVRVESYPESSSVNRIRLGEGRMPRDAGEVLVSPGVAPLGSVLRTPGGDPGDLTVVGLGQSTLSAADEVVFARPDTAALLTGIEGSNTISLRLADPTAENLETTLASVRAVLGSRSVALTSLPVSLPDGAHPIEEGITEVSFMIGSLGVVAGIVALVLLASTASAMVTERTRDAAIMRAIGARRRVARRELRRPAVFVGLLGTAIGLPLGVLVANVVAEMVLERFAGLNPRSRSTRSCSRPAPCSVSWEPGSCPHGRPAGWRARTHHSSSRPGTDLLRQPMERPDAGEDSHRWGVVSHVAAVHGPAARPFGGTDRAVRCCGRCRCVGGLPGSLDRGLQRRGARVVPLGPRDHRRRPGQSLRPRPTGPHRLGGRRRHGGRSSDPHRGDDRRLGDRGLRRGSRYRHDRCRRDLWFLAVAIGDTFPEAG